MFWFAFFWFLELTLGLDIICKSTQSCSNSIISCGGCDTLLNITCLSDCINIEFNVSNIDTLLITSLTVSGFLNTTMNVTNVNSVSLIGKDWYSFSGSEFTMDNVNKMVLSDFDEKEHKSMSFKNVFSESSFIFSNIEELEIKIIDFTQFEFQFSEMNLTNINNVSINCSTSDSCLLNADIHLVNVHSYAMLCNGANTCKNTLLQSAKSDETLVSSNIEVICGTDACHSMTHLVPVTRPYDSSYHLHCIGSNSCDGSNVYTDILQDLMINCLGTNACSMNVYSKGIITEGKLMCDVGNTGCDNTVILCSYNGGSGNYDKNCTMNLVVDTYFCNIGDSECFSTSDNPTTVTVNPTHFPSGNPVPPPTGIPTAASNNPTTHPTNDPSLIPTGTPTLNPSGSPTVDPTVSSSSPSNTPSKYPTSEPTITPTMAPTYPCHDTGLKNCSDIIAFSSSVCRDESFLTECYDSCGYCDSKHQLCVLNDTFTISPNNGSSYGGDVILVSSPCFTFPGSQLMECNFGGVVSQGTAFDSDTYICISPQRRNSHTNIVSLRIKFGDTYFADSIDFLYSENICEFGPDSGYALRLNDTINVAEPNSTQWLLWNTDLYPNETEVNIYSSVYSVENNDIEVEFIGTVLNNGGFRVTIPMIEPSVNNRYLYNIKYWIEAGSIRRRLQTNLGTSTINCDSSQGIGQKASTKAECGCTTATANVQCKDVFATAANGGKIHTIISNLPTGAGVSQGDKIAYYYCALSCYVNAATLFTGDTPDDIVRTQIYCQIQADIVLNSNSYDCKTDLLYLTNANQGKLLAENGINNGFVSAANALNDCMNYCQDAIDCSPNPCLFDSVSEMESFEPTTCSNTPVPTSPCPSTGNPTPLPTPCPTDLCKPSGVTETYCMCIDTSTTPSSGYDCNCNGGTNVAMSAWGDPHYKPADGFNTFEYHIQGRGVYTGIIIDYLNFEMQALTEECHTGVTCHYGVAFRAPNYKDVALYLNKNNNQFTFWIDGEVKTIPSNGIKLPGWVRITKSGVTHNFDFNFGLNVKVTYHTWVKNYLTVTPTFGCSLKNRAKGLYGNFNGNLNNIFQKRDGTFISKNSNNHEIYHQFGQSWAITDTSEVIFPNVQFVRRRRMTDLEWKEVKRRKLVTFDLDDDYEPVINATLEEVLDPKLKEDIINLCGNETSCIFDFIVTNDSTFAQTTIESVETFEVTVAEIEAANNEPICLPSCANNGTCFSSNISNPTVGECECINNYFGEYCQYQNITIIDINVCVTHTHCKEYFGSDYKCNLNNNTCYQVNNESASSTECILDSYCIDTYGADFICHLDTNQCATRNPTNAPSREPSKYPTTTPSDNPTATRNPSMTPSVSTSDPTNEPSANPSQTPTEFPSDNTNSPTKYPSKFPTVTPSDDPSLAPTGDPSAVPSVDPTKSPNLPQTDDPTKLPSVSPTIDDFYDAIFIFDFAISQLLSSNYNNLVSKVNNIEDIIEDGLNIDNLFVQIRSIDETEVKDSFYTPFNIDEDKIINTRRLLQFNADITVNIYTWCETTEICDSAQSILNNNNSTFFSDVNNGLNTLFNQSEIGVLISDISETFDSKSFKNNNEKELKDFILIIIVIIAILVAIVATIICVKCYCNKSKNEGNQTQMKQTVEMGQNDRFDSDFSSENYTYTTKQDPKITLDNNKSLSNKPADTNTQIKLTGENKRAHKKKSKRNITIHSNAKTLNTLWKELNTKSLSVFDDDDNINIELEELQEYFNGMNPKIIEIVFNNIDKDGNGSISPLEFFTWQHNFKREQFDKLFKTYDNYGNLKR